MKNDTRWMRKNREKEDGEKESIAGYIAPLLVFLAGMAGFAFFFCKAVCYIHDDMQSLDQMVIFETDPFMGYDNQAGENTGPDEADADAMDDSQLPDAEVYGYETLREQIPAAVYINIPGTDISYPVMWSEEKGYFLYRDSQGRHNRNGSIFLSEENAPDFSDPINYIFGHNMKSGRMFGQLNRFLDEDYLAAHSVCHIVTERATQYYTLCYAESVPATHPLVRFNDACLGTEEYNAYLQALSQRVGISFPRDTQLIELITCSQKRENRTIVYGYLCSEETSGGSAFAPQVSRVVLYIHS